MNKWKAVKEFGWCNVIESDENGNEERFICTCYGSLADYNADKIVCDHERCREDRIKIGDSCVFNNEGLLCLGVYNGGDQILYGKNICTSKTIRKFDVSSDFDKIGKEINKEKI
jgi:hypothetical protein